MNGVKNILRMSANGKTCH